MEKWEGGSQLNLQYSPCSPARSWLAAAREPGLDYRAVAAAPDSRTLKTLGQLSTIGLAFVFALVLGFGGGFWLDERLGTTPWLSLLGFALGLAAGVLNVVRTMRSVAAAERSGPSQPPAGRP